MMLLCPVPLKVDYDVAVHNLSLVTDEEITNAFLYLEGLEPEDVTNPSDPADDRALLEGLLNEAYYPETMADAGKDVVAFTLDGVLWAFVNDDAGRYIVALALEMLRVTVTPAPEPPPEAPRHLRPVD